MEAKEALNLCSPSLMLFPKFKLLISTTTLAATAAEVRPFHHLLPSIKAYYSSSSSPVDLPHFDALLSGIFDSDPAAFTRGFRAPDSIKPLLSEGGRPQMHTATAAEVRPFHHLLPSIKAYYSSSSSPVDLPHFDALLSGIFDSDPAAFTRGFRAPDSIKPLLSEPHLFLAALRSVRRRPRLALRFFRWAESQPGFPCSEAVFCAVLQILAEGGLMRAAYSVAQRVLHLRLHGIVDLLIDGHAGPEATAPLLDLLLWLYTKCSMVELAVSTFYKMVAHGFLPDVKNCNRILRILRDTAQWTEVRAIYKQMIKVGVQPTIVTFNTMLDSFCKEGKAEEALKILGEMEGQDAGCLPNDITYNVIINGLSKKGELDKAEKLLDKMRCARKASSFTYNPLISGLFSKGFVDEALGFRDEMVGFGVMPTVVTYNALIYGLCRSGRMEEAQEKFVEMGKMNLAQDVVSYNSLIYGYCRLGNVKEALCLFNHLRDAHIAPNIRTYNILIDGHCRSGALDGAQKFKEEMICSGFLPDVYTYTILVNGSCKMGNLAMAKGFFDEMLQKGLEPDCHAYTTRIVGELKLGDTSKAFQLREEMKAKGITPNTVTYNVLIDGLCKMGNLKEAYGLWQKMVHDGFHPNCVTYTCLINAHCEKGHMREAKNLFDCMLSNNLSPTVVTYTVLIHAHANKGNLEAAYGYFSKMLEENVLPNEITYNALINGLCRKHKVELAYELFDKMQGNGVCKAANKDTKKKDINICSHKIQKILREMPLVDESVMFIDCQLNFLLVTGIKI
ncbi:hypothetical protein C4D60_Mb06t36070 [Musa balbisiana]|uniref:Pentacotripeptide-repeat region of PRORP domain-containing protein n=1 Tax=Musa balbisiana TaxID=52838 RepID=A0A4S8IVM6_MUSBA|nr:hypothetical protein C4D60_Mb06t36070 [Musa balbisiana]